MSPRMHRFVKVCFAVGFGLLGFCELGGCASSPTVQYFALEPMESHGSTMSSSATLQVAQVHLPPALDRKQMVRHSGAYTLDISDQHRWSGPLDEMIRRVLSEDLIRMLPENRVILAEEPAPSTTQKIVVNILEFAPDATGTIQFAGTWSVISPDAHIPPQSRYVRLSERADAQDTVDQVKGMSRIVDRLATSMAQTLAGLPH
jgi:uncharacterized lipoprotein YmbA